MATTAGMKLIEGIECRVYGNVLGMLIAFGGLLAGVMASERSLAYWREDIIPIGLLVIIGYRLSCNCMVILNSCLMAEPVLPPQNSQHSPSSNRSVSKETIEREHAAVAQLPEASQMSAEKVVEQVVKKIEEQKAEAAKRNKIAFQ